MRLNRSSKLTSRISNQSALTIGDFYSYSLTALSIGLVNFSFGAIDLAMVAPLGIKHFAAIAQAEIIFTFLYTFLVGVTDIYIGSLATKVGRKKDAGEYFAPIIAILITTVLLSLFCILLSPLVSQALHYFGQNEELVPGIADYLRVRMYSIAPMLLFMASIETLKVLGLKTVSISALVIGAVTNALLNYIFLSIWIGKYSPEYLISVATSLCHTVVFLYSVILLTKRLRLPNRNPKYSLYMDVIGHFKIISTKAPIIGLRHMNDYLGAIFPIVLVGTLDTITMTVVGYVTKIYMFYCRVPQACLSATFVYYNYCKKVIGEHELIKRLFKYTAIPTATSLLILLLLFPLVILLGSSMGLPNTQVSEVFIAYFIFIPFYLVEQFSAEILTAKVNTKAMLVGSAIATYIITMPISYYSVVHLESAAIAIAAKGLGTIFCSIIFYKALKNSLKHSVGYGVKHA